jgi:anaerobic ribonucleoside-triphosphate reductase activating protein
VAVSVGGLPGAWPETGCWLETPWRVHAIEPRSRANGPGVRFTIWSQGCALGCPGCFNPRTHDPAGPAQTRTAGELLAVVLGVADGVDGVTLTGGEPLEQPAAVAAFCAGLRRRSDLGIVILSGFSRDEIERHPARAAAVRDADMVIAGRYNARRRIATGLRGSANKVYWARTRRYRAEDFAAVPELEIAVAADGTLTISGMP